MHELSIMMNILETCQAEAQKAQASKIKAIRLQIGEKSGVVVDSLRFVFDAAAQNTMAEGARLEIETIPLQGHCQPCDRHFHASEGFLICDLCNGFAQLTHGQELNITSIEIEEDPCAKIADA